MKNKLSYQHPNYKRHYINQSEAHLSYMLPEEQKQRKDKDKSNPFNPLSGGDKTPRKGPRFSIYWIYAIIAAVLLGANYLNSGSDIQKTTEKDFREHMYLTGGRGSC